MVPDGNRCGAGLARKKWVWFRCCFAVASVGSAVLCVSLATTVQRPMFREQQGMTLTSAPSKLVVVPFSLHNACDGQVPQLSCLETIMLDSDVDFNDRCRVLQQEWIRCDRIPISTERATVVSTVPLCVQSPRKFGVVLDSFEDKERVELPQLQMTTRRSAEHVVHQSTVAYSGFHVPQSEASDAVRAKDGNYGNFIWSFGATRMINPATTKFVPIANLGAFLEDGGNTPSGPISSFVIATANILNLEKEIESQHNTLRMWTDIAHRLNVPTAVLGIGMQLEFQNIADASHNNRLELFDFQRVFLEELASHQTSETPAIGTRGYVTSRACSDSGVNQCVSMGCPSLTISCDPNLGATLQAGWDLARQKLMFASNRTSGLGPSKRVKVDGERTAASTCNATLIRRTVEEDGRNKLRVALFAPAITKQSDDVKYRDALYRFLFNIIHEHDAFFVRQSDYDPGQIKEFSQTCGVRGGSATMKEFHNAEDWISSLNGTVDLAVSMRIHGGMSAISAGVPTIVIPLTFVCKKWPTPCIYHM